MITASAARNVVRVAMAADTDSVLNLFTRVIVRLDFDGDGQKAGPHAFQGQRGRA